MDKKTALKSKCSQIIILVGLDALLLTLVVIMAAYLNIDRNVGEREKNSDHRNNLCLPCSDLKLHPDDGLRSAKPMESDSNICCWDENTSLHEFVREFSDNWLKKQLNKENPKYCQEKQARKKYAFKVVGINQQGNGNTGMIKNLIWDKHSSFAIYEKNDYLEYHPHGQIEVKKSGVYYVYSQVLFQHNNSIDHPGNVQLNPMHMINVRAEGSTSSIGRVQMKRLTTRCVSNQRLINSTSYLGSSMLLHKGDRVAVQVHNKSEVLQIPHMNFFGVHML